MKVIKILSFLLLFCHLASFAKQDQSHEFHGKCPKAFLVCTNEDTTIFPYNNYSQWFAIWGKNEQGVYEDLLAAKVNKLYTHAIKPSLESYGLELGGGKEYHIQYIKADKTFPCWWHYQNGGGDCRFIDESKSDKKDAIIKDAQTYCRTKYGMKHGALIGVGKCYASW